MAFLREWREFKELTQQQVADAIGENRATYAKWEAGTPPMPLRVRKKIEEILKFDGEYPEGSAEITREDLKQLEKGIRDEIVHSRSLLVQEIQVLVAIAREAAARLGPPGETDRKTQT